MRIRLRFVVILLFGMMLYLSLVWVKREISLNSNLDVVANMFGKHTKMACIRPELDVNDKSIAKFFKQSSPIECDSHGDWVCIDRGKAFPCNATLERFGHVNCVYTFLIRQTEFSTVPGEVVNGTDKPVELKSDFFKVSCENEKGNKWTNIMAGIRNDSSVHSRATWDKLPPTAPKLNVLMWGFDSLSRNTFIRKLPKTYSFLTKQLGAIVLKGYNIVGDGTPQALIPILTGQTELELPETRKRKPNAQHVNVYPFVWKDFEEKGYATAYSEDCPSIATFTYRLKGFDQQPTDHYMRAFYVAAEKQYSQHKKYCLRAIPRHKVLMNWVRQFFKMYARKPKFMFTFHSELSHDDYNLVGSTDDDLRDMIKDLKDDDHLNNTLLIVMSDHGHRFASIREHQQGKQEERLPFFSFTFPPWFEKKYPRAMANFRKNAERLTTPFDIYPTLRSILHLEDTGMGSTTNRSICLFSEVPASRTCKAADIEPHWCTCLNWKTISPNNEMAIRAANSVLQLVNQLTEPDRKRCAVLTLKELVWAGMYTPTEDLLKFKKNADLDGFKADLSGSTKSSMEFYQVKMHMQPGDAHFEASLKYDVAQDIFTVREADISRTNKYGHAADCIVKDAIQLRKYCFCK